MLLVGIGVSESEDEVWLGNALLWTWLKAKGAFWGIVIVEVIVSEELVDSDIL